MILVDSSVWIDFFRNTPTAQAEWLDRNLGVEGLIVGDLILADVLIATRCLAGGLHLLQDFNAFEKHLALRVVDCEAEGSGQPALLGASGLSVGLGNVCITRPRLA